MKKFLAALIVSLGLMAAPAFAGTHCIAQSYEDFMAYTSRQNFKVYHLSDEDVEKWKKTVNSYRASKKLFPLDFDAYAFSVIPRDGGRVVGIVAFKDKCVVFGSVMVVTVEDFVKAMTDAGIDLTFAKETLYI